MEIKRRGMTLATVKARQSSFVLLNKAPNLCLTACTPERYRQTIAVVPGAPVATDLVCIRFSPGGAPHSASVARMFYRAKPCARVWLVKDVGVSDET